MTTRKIIIITPFNTMGFSYQRETDPEWIKARCKIMENFTAKSLSIQTDQDFEWHIQCRKETHYFILDNFLVNGKIPLIAPPDFSEKVINEECKGYEDLHLIRLNSDDCYHKDFVKTVRNFEYAEDKQALVFQRGLMWYQKEDIIIKRKFASPPFYSYIYKTMDYLNGLRYKVKGHNHIRSQLKTHALRNILWLWLVNEWNNKILRGSSYPDPNSKDFEKVDKSLLKDFGI